MVEDVEESIWSGLDHCTVLIMSVCTWRRREQFCCLLDENQRKNAEIWHMMRSLNRRQITAPDGADPGSRSGIRYTKRQEKSAKMQLGSVSTTTCPTPAIARGLPPPNLSVVVRGRFYSSTTDNAHGLEHFDGQLGAIKHECVPRALCTFTASSPCTIIALGSNIVCTYRTKLSRNRLQVSSQRN